MPLYRMHEDSLEELPVRRFADDGIREREDLQRLLRDSIEILAPGAMVLAEEFSDWQDSRRRIDLLCLDEDAKLVVVELKRTQDGGHMELQALRYAAMVSSMTFSRACAAHERYLAKRGIEEDARDRILDFLGWEEADEDDFASEVRLVLASADFSVELTTTVLWLNDNGIDVRCIRLAPYRLAEASILSAEQVLPLPSAQEYQVRVREKTREAKGTRRSRGGSTGYWFVNVGERGATDSGRAWADRARLGFLSAGGRSARQLSELREGDRLFAYRSGHGYVGAGVVTTPSTPWSEFRIASGERLEEKDLIGLPNTLDAPTLQNREHCIGVNWLRTRTRDEALAAPFRRPTACRIHDPELVQELIEGFGLGDEWELGVESESVVDPVEQL